MSNALRKQIAPWLCLEARRKFWLQGGCFSPVRGSLADIVMGVEDNLTDIRNPTAGGYPSMVRAFEKAGLSGVMIEDRSGRNGADILLERMSIPFDEAVAKIKAAADARTDDDFVIQSRTDTFAVNGLDDVVARLNAFSEAGADFLFADALLSEEDIAEVVKNTTKPLCVNMGFGIRQRSTTPLISAKRLQEIGVGAVIYPRLVTAGAIAGMTKALEALSEAISFDDIVERPDLVASFDEILDLTKFEFLSELEQRYATGK